MSRANWKRRLMIATLVVGGGTVFQNIGGGCGNYFAALAVGAFDFCSVLNCTSGSFFNLCGANSILIDCPTTTTTP